MGHLPSHEFFDPPSKQMSPMGHPPPKIKLPTPLKSDTPPFIEKRSLPPFNEKRRPLPRTASLAPFFACTLMSICTSILFVTKILIVRVALATQSPKVVSRILMILFLCVNSELWIFSKLFLLDIRVFRIVFAIVFVAICLKSFSQR